MRKPTRAIQIDPFTYTVNEMVIDLYHLNDFYKAISLLPGEVDSDYTTLQTPWLLSQRDQMYFLRSASRLKGSHFFRLDDHPDSIFGRAIILGNNGLTTHHNISIEEVKRRVSFVVNLFDCFIERPILESVA